MSSHRSKKRRKHKKNRPGVFKVRKHHVVSSIETDGVGVSILFKAELKMPRYKTIADDEKTSKRQREAAAQRRHEEKMRRLVSLPNARHVGIDPGRVNLYVAAEENERVCPCAPVSYKKTTFTRNKLMRMTGRLQMEQWMNKRVADHPAVARALDSLAETSGLHVHDETSWNAYLTRRLEHKKVLDNEFMELDERCRLRMVCYRRRQRALALAADNLVMESVRQKTPCIVGYGTGWGGASGGKGERTVPVKAMYRAIVEAFRRHRLEGGVVDVWEYGTTQKCHRCGERMAVLYRPSTGSLRLQEDRDFRCCTKCTDEQRKYRNRDFNAAINILKCLQAMLEGTPRPEYLRPPTCGAQKRQRKSTSRVENTQPIVNTL
jgi:hypothetical protein